MSNFSLIQRLNRVLLVKSADSIRHIGCSPLLQGALKINWPAVFTTLESDKR